MTTEAQAALVIEHLKANRIKVAAYGERYRREAEDACDPMLAGMAEMARIIERDLAAQIRLLETLRPRVKLEVVS